jgi:3-oxoadipate enol-lactonase
MPYLERSGAPRLHYVVDDFTDPWRDAPYLILQHGFGRSSQFWYSWVPYLSRFYRVVRPDLRGLGRSDTNFDLAKGISVEAYIGDLIALFDHLGAERVHYCGESLGGIIGMALAAEHPDRIRTLNLVAAPVRVPRSTQEAFSFGMPSWQEAMRTLGSQAWSDKANAATRFPAGTDPGMLRWYADEMGKSNVDVLVAVSLLASRVNATPFLARIQAPVLGLYPTGGIITGEEEVVIRREIKNLRIVHFPTAYHSIMTMMPAACARHVLSFAATVDGVTFHE